MMPLRGGRSVRLQVTRGSASGRAASGPVAKVETPSSELVPNALTLLRGIQLFRGLSDPALERVGALLRVRRYRRGQVIFRKGDPCDSLYVVITGRVSITSLSVHGA